MTDNRQPTDPDRDGPRCSKCHARGALCIIPGSGKGPMCEPCLAEERIDSPEKAPGLIEDGDTASSDN